MSNEESTDETEDHAAIELPSEIFASFKKQMDNNSNSPKGKGGGQKNSPVERPHEVFLGGIVLGTNSEVGDGRAEDSNSRDPERERNKDNVTPSKGCRGNDTSAVGLKEIGSHSSDISNIVSNIVGNHSRVARIILGDARLNLSNEIGTNVSCLGVDTTGNTGKESNGTSSESKSSKGVDSSDHLFK